MPIQSSRDVHALELGFIADGVLRALRAAGKVPLAPTDVDALQVGAGLLRSLSSGVGSYSPPVSGSPRLHMNALTSFAYAAEALRSMSVPKLTTDLRDYFELLADTLEDVIAGTPTNEEHIKSVVSFFEGFSEATFENWSSRRGETLRGPEPKLWTTS